MHIPDGFVNGPLNLCAAAVSLTAVGVGLRQITRRLKSESQKVPLLATSAAFVFAAHMLNFPIGGGTSGHFLGAALVTALLGPSGACVVLALVLVIQGLLFGDGGLTALGTNVLNMGILAGLGGYCVMRLFRSVLPAGRTYFLASAGFGGWFSVVLASLACSLELAYSGTSPLVVVVPAMVGTHIIIGIGEGLITAAALSTIAIARPEILPHWTRLNALPAVVRSAELSPAKKRARAAGPVLAGLGLSLLLAAFCSPFASESPDGLEKVAEAQGFLSASDKAALWQSAPLPDYTMPPLQSAAASTGLAGLTGTLVVFLAGYVLIRLLQLRARSGSDSCTDRAEQT